MGSPFLRPLSSYKEPVIVDVGAEQHKREIENKFKELLNNKKKDILKQKEKDILKNRFGSKLILR